MTTIQILPNKVFKCTITASFDMRVKIPTQYEGTQQMDDWIEKCNVALEHLKSNNGTIECTYRCHTKTPSNEAVLFKFSNKSKRKITPLLVSNDGIIERQKAL